MNTKILELRDRATFIVAVAVRMDPRADQDAGYLLRRVGYGDPMVLLTRADGGRAAYDPYEWGDRTFQVAHHYISQHWDELADGDVVDVEFVLGETNEKKLSERYTA